MLDLSTITTGRETKSIDGSFLQKNGERWYVIRNVDQMAPFFISVVSNSDHWLFISSNGGLTTGRVSPEHALFPYATVDKIHESTGHTGSKTIFRVCGETGTRLWEPFNREHDGHFSVSRHLYKNTLGNKICFEEINHDLQLAYRYTWMTSDRFGVCRESELENLSQSPARIEALDGLQNILPAGIPTETQNNASNLADAYKWTELFEETGLALYALYAKISDRAEPFESLRANTAFCLGLDKPTILVSSKQLNQFRAGGTVQTELRRRGIRGAYLVSTEFRLGKRESRRWRIVANTSLSQAEVMDINEMLRSPAQLDERLAQSIASGSEQLARLMATTDAYQAAGEESVTAHHYANVLFNNLRGGVVDDQYRVLSKDVARTIEHFNRPSYERLSELFDELPDSLPISDLQAMAREQDDPSFERLCQEYLPIRFGRRHGDPSRPWNHFAIKLKDADGNPLLSYEGNWRDIFQNWEALAFSYPGFVGNMIAKFVNASTMDGYNPYRITKEGIDWEVEDPDDPWSYIGYWGDHQVIYLLKLLELSQQFFPGQLADLLHRPIFAFANVPYRIKPVEELLANPKSTVVYDQELAEVICNRVGELGEDGKLILNAEGNVCHVNLLEKLLVPLLSKLGNLVVDGGIWLNTQRPEWNDANNALVGHGLSMVTLYYLRRYIRFLAGLVTTTADPVSLSKDVATWLQETVAILGKINANSTEQASSAIRYRQMLELGSAASRYRQSVFARGFPANDIKTSKDQIIELLEEALVVVDRSIASNRRLDGLYEAYNIVELAPEKAEVSKLYLMLEGQVAALSSGAVNAEDACRMLEALFTSEVYCRERHSFMLYPDRSLPGFLEKNRIAQADLDYIPLLKQMIEKGDTRIVQQDVAGNYRFNADFANADDLDRALLRLAPRYGKDLAAARKPLLALYEKVFRHREFTGRSGSMFGYEGLGCIYWHMVSKLLLAIQENFYAALDQSDPNCADLAKYYYRVREGLGFNKSPEEYGAFPADPYSHTPKGAGARQPGMTGQVKEEILCRFGELGIRVTEGQLKFQPALLRKREFLAKPVEFHFVDVAGNWQILQAPAEGLAFTWCQVPFIYRLADTAEPTISVIFEDDKILSVAGMTLPIAESRELFLRSGRIRRIEVQFPATMMTAE